MMPVGCPLGASASAGPSPGDMKATSSSWQILTKTSLAETFTVCPSWPLARDANDLAERLLLDAGEERLDDAELDVGLEQREAHLAQRRLDVLLGQLGQAREAVSGRFEPFGEGVEHGVGVRLSTGRGAGHGPGPHRG